MVNFKLTRQIENLEKELQTIKWEFLQPYLRKPMKHPVKGIVQNTAGILGKAFPKGTSYENAARKSWKRRTALLGI